MKIYTIDELKKFKRNKAVIYINSKEEHDKLRKELNLCEYYGNYCYSFHDKTYDSTSDTNQVGYYTGAELIKFSQIADFQENVLNNLIIW